VGPDMAVRREQDGVGPNHEWERMGCHEWHELADNMNGANEATSRVFFWQLESRVGMGCERKSGGRIWLSGASKMGWGQIWVSDARGTAQVGCASPIMLCGETTQW
jgi:hypothetical protein